MSLYALITCDLCNSEARVPNDKPAEGLTDDGSSVIVDRGWLFAEWEEAEGLGWERREFGEICEVCVIEEGLQAKRDLEEEADSYVGSNILIDKLIEGLPEEEEE
jgi:hypothetical protein